MSAVQTCMQKLNLRGCMRVRVRVCVCGNLLIKVRFGDGKEAAVTVSTHTEDKRLASEHGQMTHQLARVSHKQTRVLISVNHPLVYVQRARDHKLHAHLLKYVKCCRPDYSTSTL